jgi:hypothetical protein
MTKSIYERYTLKKKCAHCNYIKPLADFNRDKEHLHGRDRLCRPCRRAFMFTYRYGVHHSVKTELYVLQGERCPGCDTDIPESEMVLDHDHETGNPRGVLCQACNKVLGFAKDKETTLYALIDYLANPTWRP